MGFFDNVPVYPPDPIFGLSIRFGEDPRKQKANLTVGIYNDENLFPKKLDVVREVEEHVIEENKRAEYLPIFGHQPYIEATGKLVLGDIWEKERSRIFAVQGLGGTGALRILADFFKKEINTSVFLPDPTWPNHYKIFEKAGLKVECYPYYNKEKHNFAFEQMADKLENVPEKSIILLHASCHNPTGCDPTRSQWKELSKLFKRRNLIPHFDLAYQGLGEGVQEDVESIRLFASDGHEMVVSVTHSKSFGLYNQRVGHDMVIGKDSDTANRVKTSLRMMIRSNYSNPPIHGASVVAHILQNSKLREKWEEELCEMRTRITDMQEAFASALIEKSKKTDFSFLRGRKGLFAYTELSPAQIEYLVVEKGIYIPSNGRVNVTRMNKEMLDYITQNIAEASDTL